MAPAATEETGKGGDITTLKDAEKAVIRIVTQ